MRILIILLVLPFTITQWKLNFCRISTQNKKHAENNKVQIFCCAGPSGISMETNKLYHDLHDEILNWLGHFMFVLVWTMKRNLNSSPPSFKGRRWGSPLFCSFSLHVSHHHDHEAVQSIKNFIVEVMVSFIYFHCNIEGCCAAEILYLFFRIWRFGD